MKDSPALTRLRTHIGSLLSRRGLASSFDDEESLVKSGALDSIEVVSIIRVLEKELGVSFAKNGLDQDSIDTFAQIRAVVKRFGTGG